MSINTSIDTGLSMYAALAQRMRTSIMSGEFQPGQLLGSEHDLARKQNISRVTVRKASEMLVNEGLLERRPGKGLYVRDNSAKERVGTRLIQVVAGNLRWEPCIQVSRGAQAAAKELGIQVQLYDAHGDAELDLEVVRGLPESSARGAIIVSLHSAAFNEAVFELKRQNYPFVLVDQRLHDINVPSVMADNHAGGLAMGAELVGLGHRRIGFIGNTIASTVTDRLNGLRDAMGDAGIAFDRSLVMDLGVEKDPLGDWSTRVDECTRSMMARADRPTAIFCSCDAVARSTYRTLAQMGLNVPGDVSVVGFDDDPLAEWLTPGLTTVRQPHVAMGKAAIDLLSARMTNPNASVEHRVLPVELVRRGSAGRVGETQKP
jgi:DNA-binding LacI/PurR family transcriptional regulator